MNKPATPLPWKQGKWVTSGHPIPEYVYCLIGNENRVCSVSVHGKRFKDGKHTSIRHEDGSYTGKIPERDADADAAYIVEACNAYPKLLDDKRRLVEALGGMIRDAEATYDACKRPREVEISLGQFRRLNTARALLAELEGKA